MRGKRSKQYRKLMTQYSQIWGFREPYQCLIDAEMVVDCHKFKYDLLAGLKRTLHGEIKPMISQCEIRKLYARKTEPEMGTVIDFAKTLERRRCGHLPEDYPEPLSTAECFKAVVDPKGNGVNKHKLVAVCQDGEVRRMLRAIPGVPQIYIKRSVMILEPMASESTEVREKEERSKYRAGLKKKVPVAAAGSKRKRTEAEEDGKAGGDAGTRGEAQDAAGPIEATPSEAADAAAERKKKKKQYGTRGPNPLAVKKKSSKKPTRTVAVDYKEKSTSSPAKAQGQEEEERAKKKRKRRYKGQSGDGGEAPSTTGGAEVMGSDD